MLGLFSHMNHDDILDVVIDSSEIDINIDDDRPIIIITYVLLVNGEVRSIGTTDRHRGLINNIPPSISTSRLYYYCGNNQ